VNSNPLRSRMPYAQGHSAGSHGARSELDDLRASALKIGSAQLSAESALGTPASVLAWPVR
jgi:hypothetical protein